VIDAREDDRPLIATQWPGLYIREGFAPREQFSASQLDLRRQCPRAWGYRYLMGVRKPEPVWHDGLTGRERSLAFGKALHARLESYFKNEPVIWTDAIGQASLAGLHYLPTEGAVSVEEPITLDSEKLIHLDEPVHFVGFMDLVVYIGGAPEALYDYKTTGDFKWIKSRAELEENEAANLYALALMNKSGESRQACRWLYFKSKGAPCAQPVDFSISRDRAEPIVRSMIIQAATLRQEIREGYKPADLPTNLGSCRNYGGCPYHYGVGGPCEAERAGINAGLITPDRLLAGVSESQVRKDESTMTQPAPMPTGSLAERLAASLAERLAASRAAAAGAPAQPAQGAPPAAAAPPAFNPAAGGFAPPAAAAAAQGFAPPGFGGAPPAPAAPAQPTFPAAPGFASSMPAAAPAAAPAGFPPAPAMPPPGTPAPAFSGFANVNPPEQTLAAPPGSAPPAPPPADVPAPGARRGRPRKAQGQGAPAPGQTVPTAQGPDWQVTIRLSNGEGLLFEVPADQALANELIQIIHTEAKRVLG